MKRRHVIKGVAAGGVMGVGLAGAAHEPAYTAGDVSQYEYLRIERDGETVGRIVDPTWETVQAVDADLDDDAALVTPDEECVAFCESNCPCYPCLVGCFNCCNPSENICDGCRDPD